ncbi:hypothetical protein BDN71DRAFT_1441721 [Pleurotus eryngii]|uniref:Peptidase M20 dimerisation domain-containing protein n=1 Tax=Pleurotus eryngii TaxID=5323 RepID=A0A9P6A469_PLEER|nr:hypothetical protein BDN71DRAFT_1441721 [Pleurotus eryngii]
MHMSLIGTTQAITLTQGGVKSNAIPEQAWAVINHRIATERCVSDSMHPIANTDLRSNFYSHSSVAATVQHDTQLLKSLGNKFNLTYTSFGAEMSEKDARSSGTLTLSEAWGTALEPASITPTGRDAAPYALLAGTIKATFNLPPIPPGRQHRYEAGYNDWEHGCGHPTSPYPLPLGDDFSLRHGRLVRHEILLEAF